MDTTVGGGHSTLLWRPRFLRRYRRFEEVGQGLVEFALILPIFLLLIFALVDFGRAFFTWQVVTNAAREGARAAAVQGNGAAVENAILASFCNPAPTDCALDLDNLLVADNGNIQGDRGESVAITVSYDFVYVTPIGQLLALVGGAALATPTIQSTATMRLE
jgi:Flp pilus assembly protein TadG